MFLVRFGGRPVDSLPTCARVVRLHLSAESSVVFTAEKVVSNYCLVVAMFYWRTGLTTRPLILISFIFTVSVVIFVSGASASVRCDENSNLMIAL